MSQNLLSKWTEVTGNLSWGKQRTLLDTLNLVQEGKVKVVYGANDYQGSPCLINAVGCMVKEQHDSPSQNEPALVTLFDSICRNVFVPAGIIENGDASQGYLSSLAAEILVRNFAPLKPIPDSLGVAVEAKYKEPKDAELQADFEKMLDTPAPDALPIETASTVEEFEAIRRKSE